MTSHTPFFRQVAAAEAKRKPCPEPKCRGPYSDKLGRPFHKFDCPRNPLFTRYVTDACPHGLDTVAECPRCTGEGL